MKKANLWITPAFATVTSVGLIGLAIFFHPPFGWPIGTIFIASLGLLISNQDPEEAVYKTEPFLLPGALLISGSGIVLLAQMADPEAWPAQVLIFAAAGAIYLGIKRL